jgi:hypothetical protein
MGEIAALESLVRRATSRRRWLNGWSGLWRGLVMGAGIFLAAIIAYKLAPVPELAIWTAGGVWMAAGLAGFSAGFLKRVNPLGTARWLDQQAGLHDRISTALEVSKDTRAPADWRALVISDAAVRASDVDPRRLMPLDYPKTARYAALIAGAALVLAFVPEYRSPVYKQKELETTVIKDVGTNLTAIARKDLRERPPAQEPVRRQLEAVGDLGEKLQSAKLTRNEALTELARAADSLQKQSEELARNPALRRMEKAAREAGGKTANPSAALQKQINALNEALGQKAAQNPDAIEDLKNEMKKLAEQAKAMAGDNSAKSAEARAEAAKAASELARKADALGLSLPNLNEAIAALNAAQVERFLKNLEQATSSLEQMAEMASQLAKLQEQSEKVGKDLGEQLQNGQAEAAMESLQRMMDELKKQSAGSEQCNNVANEVEKSLKPAGNYGKVADQLKKAMQQAKSGDKQGAQQSLASAKNELKNMLDQMGDAQQMMSALQNLKTAQMAVGNCTSWGQCAGNGTPKAGKGGKGGKGVGTWSENSAWAMPEQIDDLWDNSGINRPDRAGKGTTDRDTSLADGLTPTKIQGQMQPGGPMPSITLKGVSIKGNSKVDYTEAITTAQDDARAALSEDQVPKAYRGAVRDYFDDLKK